MTKTAKVAVALVARVLTARIVATALETMAVSGVVGRVGGALVVAGAIAGGVYMARKMRSAR